VSADEYVVMTHPKLPGQPIRVRANKTGPRLASGWEVAEPEAEEQAGDADPGEEAKAPKRTSKRRTDATDTTETEAS